MIKETGKIISIKEQHGEKIAVVECISKSACSGCHNQESCGVGSIAKTHGEKTHQFEVAYKAGMKVDESIELQINNRDLVHSAIVAYLVPLVFFIGGAVFAKQLEFLSEGLMIVIAVGFAAVGFLFTRLVSHKLFPKKQFDSIITTKLKK
jgi:sigma-E factor negative regulatory protein RseC